MRYNVVGQNRDTGARMTLEFEAESKAAAERKAAQAGMSVHHVTDVTNGHAEHRRHQPRATAGRCAPAAAGCSGSSCW